LLLLTHLLCQFLQRAVPRQLPTLLRHHLDRHLRQDNSTVMRRLRKAVNGWSTAFDLSAVNNRHS
jgi:hypothetical protein